MDLLTIKEQVLIQDPGPRKSYGKNRSPRALIHVLKRAKYGPLMLSSYVKNGIDLSKWNGNMDFAVTAPLIDFAYLRGGYGVVKDYAFEAYRAGMMQYNKPYGIYWYVYIGSNIEAQAQAFVNVVKSSAGWKLPPVADFEATSLSAYATTEWIKLFMDRLADYGLKPNIYTSPGWWNRNVLRNTWAANYPLWVAHWTSADTPLVPLDWKMAQFWQWSADGNRKAAEYGSTGGDYDMDLNRFCGDLAAWRKLIGESEPTPPPPEPTPPPPAYEKYQVVTSPYVNVRLGPSGADMGDLYNGSICYIFETVDKDGYRWGRMGSNLWVALYRFSDGYVLAERVP